MLRSKLGFKKHTMMQTPTDKFWAFFEPIVTAVPGVVYTGMSDGDRMDRFWADSRSEDTYPGVFVMRPKYKGSYDAVMTTYFTTTFYVMCQGDLNDYLSQDAAYHQSEEIVQQIEMAVQHKAYEGKCFFNFEDFYAEPIIYQMSDSAWGYEVKMKIGLIVNDIMC